MTESGSPPQAGAPRRLWWALGLFMLLVIAVVAGSVRRPHVPVFTLDRFEPRDVPAGLAGPDTVTLDGRAGDRWVRFDLARRRVAGPGEPWDVGVRRNRLIVNGGEGLAGVAGVVRLDRPFGQVVEAPEEGYEASRVTPDGDTVNTVLDGWYRYGFFSHLLTPAAGTFVLRTHDGRFAKLAVLGYYCPGPEAGCVTLTFVYQGDGSRRLR